MHITIISYHPEIQSEKLIVLIQLKPIAIFVGFIRK